MAAAAIAAELLERYVTGTLARTQQVQHYVTSMTAHKSWITRVPRNQACRSPHEHWALAGCVPRDVSLEGGVLSVPGFPVVRRLRCACGAEQRLLYVAARLTDEQLRCRICGQTMRYGAFDLIDEIDLSALEEFGPGKQTPALADIGVVDRDIVRIGDACFEIGRRRSEGEKANG